MLDNEYKKLIDSWEVPPPADAWAFIEQSINKAQPWYSKTWGKVALISTTVAVSAIAIVYSFGLPATKTSSPVNLNPNQETTSNSPSSTINRTESSSIQEKSTTVSTTDVNQSNSVSAADEKATKASEPLMPSGEVSNVPSGSTGQNPKASDANSVTLPVIHLENTSQTTSNSNIGKVSLILSSEAICIGKIVYITVLSNVNSVLDFGDNNKINLIQGRTHLPYTYAQAGIYTISILQNDKVVASKDIMVDAKVQAYFKTNTLENSSIDFQNLSLAANKFFWYFGDGITETTNGNGTVNHYYKATSKRVYQVKHIAMNTKTGCSDTFESEVKNPNFKNYFSTVMPNVFTPNNDGLNDVFEIPASELKEWYIIIMNQATGQVVFETNKQQNYWNGKMNNQGNECPKGTYRYIIKYMQPDDEEMHQKSGYITLLRE